MEVNHIRFLSFLLLPVFSEVLLLSLFKHVLQAIWLQFGTKNVAHIFGCILVLLATIVFGRLDFLSPRYLKMEVRIC